jgi:transcriptional regulator with XRE-family HTH domain
MLSQRIKAARIAKGLTQAEAAKTLGVGQKYISKLELGDKRPSVEMLAKLAQLYGVSESYLLGSRVAEHCAEYNGATPPDDNQTPQGLRDLAADEALVESLKITPAEWLALNSLLLPTPTDKAGYVQLLATIRGVTRG